MGKYRKKPVEIEAVQLLWSTWPEMVEFVGADNPARESTEYSDTGGEVGSGGAGGDWIELTIPTLEGDHLARHGDWIIRGVSGELYPCRPDIFRATYEPV